MPDHPKKPFHILKDPLLNKDTAFTLEERQEKNLLGLLPCHVSTVEEQLKRTYYNFMQAKTPLDQYLFLSSLMNQNEKLFYQFVEKYLEKTVPLIYTPTVGDAALQYSLIYRQARGLYVCYPLKDKIAQILENAPYDDVEVIVVTDGERILGLGDQGIGGMVIPVGKLCLYTLFAGIHPSKTLPVILDVGTNNPSLLSHEMYLGYRSKRVTGKDYDDFVDLFIQAVKKRYPKALLQWEDFGRQNARRFLDLYREKIPSFNDDIQGTSATVIGGILSALQTAQKSFVDQKIVIFGGGSAGLGILEGLLQMMEYLGKKREDSLAQFYLFDKPGLLHTGLELSKEHQRYAQDQEKLKSWQVKNPSSITLLEVMQNAAPNILIGVSAQEGAFSKEAIQEMSKHQEHPIIFPLSNPPSKMEAFPDELIEWSDKKAIIATGSPFEPVAYKGEVYEIGQCNNVYIFPGVGLGALASQSKMVTDTMFLEAATTLAKFSPRIHNKKAALFPKLRDLKKVSKEIALAVAKQAVKEKVAKNTQNLEEEIEKKMWKISYE